MDRSLIVRHFCKELRSVIEKHLESDFARCQEIRLRVNRSLGVFDGRESKSLGAIVRPADIKYCFESVCQYSVHSFAREIKAGYITVAGGHRAGFCGTAVTGDLGDSHGVLETVKHISGINFRVAREVRGSAEGLVKRLYLKRLSTYMLSPLPSVLICGGVGSGKTTLLRDTARLLGEHLKISLIDCRGELAAVYDGVPAFDIGANTDVFDGYDKAAGIETSVRVMSPQIIIADEIGGAEDIAALQFARLSGVAVIASIHAGELRDIAGKGITKSLFDYAVFLKGTTEPAAIDRIVDLGLAEACEVHT